MLSSSSGERSETGGPSGAEGDLFRQAVVKSGTLDRVALPRAAGSPGLRRSAACRRMTTARGCAPGGGGGLDAGVGSEHPLSHYGPPVIGLVIPETPKALSGTPPAPLATARTARSDEPGEESMQTGRTEERPPPVARLSLAAVRAGVWGGALPSPISASLRRG